jgi:BirA family biotin operon repressor/biotin-[acetyl-CoA-carboxylase] ligase
MGDAAKLSERLSTRRYGRSLTWKVETGSTNDDAREAALAGAPDGHLVIADAQTSGRGSRGRTWVSPPGQDLYLSLVAQVPLTLPELPPLTLAIGLAVADTVESFVGPGELVQVKWPNDVWLGGKKCAGILVESVSFGDARQPIVIGIGLNVNRRSFPPNLDTEPTSLALSRGADLERAEVLALLLQNLERWVDRFVEAGVQVVARELAPRLAMRGERARCDDVHGVVLGVSQEGALLMDTEQGVRTVLSGTLRRER